ncbi:MAG TPA: acyl-CoA thioesterase II [Acidimicrobiales bacterium]|nr:acyl-CoA thioesterase II [Acidimicrobiales bacterium]
MNQDALDDLVGLLDLERIEVNIFRGQSPDENRQRVFGGQVAGQALIAAGRTVEESIPAGQPARSVHSLHAYFLRPGDPTTPIVYEVDRVRDGRSFTTRRVTAIQRGRAIFTLAASFQVEEPGVDHQLRMPDAPDAESLPDFVTRMAPFAEQMGDWYTRPRPIDLRFVSDPPRGGDRTPRPPTQQVWFRADGKLPDDPLLHVCVAAYASDMTLLDSIFLAHGLRWEDGNIQGASLDHAMWFHRPFRADEWLLYDQVSPSASGARGFAEGRIFTHDGRLAVSVVQEGLVRVVNSK